MKPKQFDDWAVMPNLWGAAIGAPIDDENSAIRSALGPYLTCRISSRKTGRPNTG